MTVAVTTLPAQDRSPATARRAVQEVLTAAGLEVMLDDALLLVSELVTNAVVHAGTEIELHIDIGPGIARIEVIDHGPGLPSGTVTPTTPARAAAGSSCSTRSRRSGAPAISPAASRCGSCSA